MPKTKIINSTGITAAIGLAALPAIFSLAPMFGVAEANAEPSTIGAAATIVPNLSLSAENVSMIMTPTGSGTVFKTASVDATVSTNNETGYTLYFSDKDDNTSLKHANLADKAITSTENTLSGNDMLPNTWGYTLDAPAPEGENEFNNATNLGLTYNSIPTDYTAINSSDTLTEGETSKLTFGVKINNGIPSGTYSDEILISAVINYSSLGYDQNQLWLGADGNQIEAMQQMTPAVCASVPTPTVSAVGANVPEIELEDTRDGKKYKVRKLADGNCWMTESLKLGSTTEDILLTPEKSNVTTNFTLHAAKTSADQTVNSYDIDYTFTGNDTNNNTYLYNWYTATAGYGTQSLTANQSVAGDICPKGWQLPDKEGDMSWDKLLRDSQGVYEIATSSNDYNTTKVSWGKFTGGIETASTNPLGLQVTGYFLGGSLSSAATSGDYWTRTASSDTGAYHLGFYSSSVYPKNVNNKHHGFAVRCVASGTKEYMQDWAGCSELPEHKTAILYDKRDDKEYTVSKLKDGNCWMTSDLNISGVEIEPTKSNVTQEILNAAAVNDASDFTITGGNAAFNLPAATASTSTTNNATKAQVANDGYGNPSGTTKINLYNWYAATAGTGKNTMKSESLDSPTNAPGDICPKGWQLPNASGDKSWDKLLRDGQGVYEIATLKDVNGATESDKYVNPAKVAWGSYDRLKIASRNPLGLHVTGGFWDSNLRDTGNGYYWSRTADTNTANAYRLNYDSVSVRPQRGSGKTVGFAVRCVSE